MPDMFSAEHSLLAGDYFFVIPDANTRIAKTTMNTAITSKTSRVIVI